MTLSGRVDRSGTPDRIQAAVDALREHRLLPVNANRRVALEPVWSDHVRAIRAKFGGRLYADD
jgi:hypothetical protein